MTTETLRSPASEGMGGLERFYVPPSEQFGGEPTNLVDDVCLEVTYAGTEVFISAWRLNLTPQIDVILGKMAPC